MLGERRFPVDERGRWQRQLKLHQFAVGSGHPFRRSWWEMLPAMTTPGGDSPPDLIWSDVRLLVLVLVRNEVRPVSWTVEGG